MTFGLSPSSTMIHSRLLCQWQTANFLGKEDNFPRVDLMGTPRCMMLERGGQSNWAKNFTLEEEAFEWYNKPTVKHRIFIAKLGRKGPIPVNEAEISRYITETFEGVDVVADSGNSFFFYNPDSNVPPDHRFPFVTLVTSDLYDPFSNLNRPSIFRLNIGIGKQTFRSLFGENSSSYDFTALDQVMPHPVYGRMYWVCVLNPSNETFETKVWQLLAEAYDLAVSKYKRQAARR